MEKTILEAARAVLVERGGLQFTTNHVCEAAGISVGSLYQYFPNKGAILLRLEISEMEQTVEGLSRILSRKQSAEHRLRKAIRFFFETEYRERDVRAALKEVRSLFDSSEETTRIRARAYSAIVTFLSTWNEHRATESTGDSKKGDLTRQANEVTGRAAELVMVTVSSMAETVSDQKDKKQIQWWADECFAMLYSRLSQWFHPISTAEGSSQEA